MERFEVIPRRPGGVWTAPPRYLRRYLRGYQNSNSQQSTIKMENGNEKQKNRMASLGGNQEKDFFGEQRQEAVARSKKKNERGCSRQLAAQEVDWYTNSLVPGGEELVVFCGGNYMKEARMAWRYERRRYINDNNTAAVRGKDFAGIGRNWSEGDALGGTPAELASSEATNQKGLAGLASESAGRRKIVFRDPQGRPRVDSEVWRYFGPQSNWSAAMSQQQFEYEVDRELAEQESQHPWKLTTLDRGVLYLRKHSDAVYLMKMFGGSVIRNTREAV